MHCSLQNCCRVIWPNYVKCLAKCLARAYYTSPFSCSSTPNYKQEIDKPAKLWIKAVWCNFSDLYQSFCCGFIFGPWGEVSFYELKFSVQDSYIWTMPCSSSRHCSKFHINTAQHRYSGHDGLRVNSSETMLLRKPWAKPLKQERNSCSQQINFSTSVQGSQIPLHEYW